MSAGGVFKILTNDGKADQMLMATQLLKDRICDIIDARTAAGLKDTLPTLKDLEKTHVLHFQSKFKPFVALGYEYQKVKPQSGTTQLGGSVTFSIPQFGDFLSDMVLHVGLSQCGYASASVGTLSTDLPAGVSTISGSTATTANTATSILPDGTSVPLVEFSGKRVIVRRFTSQKHVDANGNLLVNNESVADRAFYCEYPGERLMQKVSFDVNGNPLDDYDYMSYAFHRKFRVSSDKKVAYDRNMGQQILTTGQDQLCFGGMSKQMTVGTGPQTPQTQQPSLSMWIKLLFWFNLDQSQALVSAAIPYGQRFINIDLAKAEDLVGRAPACWQRVVMTTDVISNASGATSVSIGSNPGLSSPDAEQSYSEILYYPVYTNGALSAPSISSLELYVNNIFTIPEVHDIYIERIGFSLIRVHRIQREGVNASQKDILLSQFKYPIEFFYCGLRPDENVNSDGIGSRSGNKYADWHRFSVVGKQRVISTSRSVSVSAGNATITSVTEPAMISTEQRTIDTVSVTAHGVALYNSLDSSFFNQYLPEVYGGSQLVAPRDQGVLFVNFCLHPYSLQPSGHINTSRAREFFINISSSAVPSASKSATFLAEASALNFLLVSDGTAVLRYTT